MPTYCVQYAYDEATSTRRDEVRPAHRAFLRSMLDAGALLASGPLTDPADAALLVVRADDARGVASLLDADPFWVEGLVAGRTVRGWDPVIGPWAD